VAASALWLCGQRGRAVETSQKIISAHRAEPPCLTRGPGNPSGTILSARPAVIVPATRAAEAQSGLGCTTSTTPKLESVASA
jgi:hypothetical protein